MTDPDNESVINAGELQIGIDPDVANGIYANLAMINHSPDEFIVDFIFVQPGAPRGQVRSRVVLAPGHYKRLLAAMQQNLERYESTFGTIETRLPQIPMPDGPVN